MSTEADIRKIRGVKRSRRDPARALALIRKIQIACEKAGRFRGMTEEQVLAKLRETREEVWNELKNAPCPRR